MNPRTAGTGRSQSRKPPLRLQIPVDNPDVEAFFAAQGMRNQSQAIVMLIRMWVNEFGPTSVMDQTMGATTLSRLKQDSAEHSAPAGPASQKRRHPAQIVEPEPAPEPEPEPDPAPPLETKTVPKAAPAPIASSDSIDDLFRR